MTKEEAIKFLQQIYPNGGHCWLDEQRIEAIGMAIKALQEEPAPKIFEDMLNAKTPAESLGISAEEHDMIVDELIYGKEPEMVDVDDLPNKEEEPVSDDLKEAAIMHYKDVMEYEAKTGLKPAYMTSFKAGAKWQKEKDESTTEDLGEYINELSKQFPEVSFAKLSRIAVRVAKWQKEQFEKNRLANCDKQTEEEAEIELDFVMSIIEKEHRQPTFDDAIKYGMRLQKEQMMKKAIDGDVTFDYYGDGDKTYGCIAHDSFCLEDFGLKDRDKVKLIIINQN